MLPIAFCFQTVLGHAEANQFSHGGFGPALRQLFVGRRVACIVGIPADFEIYGWVRLENGGNILQLLPRFGPEVSRCPFRTATGRR